MRRLTGFALAAAIVVSACSDDEPDAPSPSAEATEPTTAPTAPPGSAAVTSGSSAPASSAPDGGEAEAGPPAFTLGFMAPGAGLLNSFSIAQQRGLTLALEDINAAGGVLGGSVELVTAVPSGDQPPEAVVDDLEQQGATAFIGPVGSADAFSVEPALAERSLLTCSASATARALTAAPAPGPDGEPPNPAVFVRTALRDDYYAAVVDDELMSGEDPPATVAIVGRDDQYANELIASLAADLTARGASVTTIAYPPRRVTFAAESAEVQELAPDLVILVAYAEAPNMISQLIEDGTAPDRIVGLDGALVPRLAEQAFPSDPGRADGVRVIGPTGDRLLIARLGEVAAVDDQLVYGAQAYDCAIAMTLAAAATGSTDPVSISGALSAVTGGGRTCSTYAHCIDLLAAGEDIDYDGASGRLDFDAAGDITTTRLTTAEVIDGRLQPVSSRDVDLPAARDQARFAAAVFVAQLQQGLRVLGYYDGDVTGVYDDATREAVAALQRDLGLPDTGEYDEATDAALRERLGSGRATLTATTMQLQQALTDLGYYDGPIDGRYSDAVIAAVRAFQRDLGVPETGVLDAATAEAIFQRGIAAGTVPPPEPTPDPGPEPTPDPTPEPTPDPTPAPTPPPTTAAPTTEPPPTTAPPEPERQPLFDVLAEMPEMSTLIEVARRGGLRQRPAPTRTAHGVRPDQPGVRHPRPRRARDAAHRRRRRRRVPARPGRRGRAGDGRPADRTAADDRRDERRRGRVGFDDHLRGRHRRRARDRRLERLRPRAQRHPRDPVSDDHVSTGRLPQRPVVEDVLREGYERFRTVDDGAVADYIPALARASPALFGACLANTVGDVLALGDADHPFSIQSVSKPFVFALVCDVIGAEAARARLGVNSTGLPFNSVMAVELNDKRTMNPMVNAGAIATTSLVPGETAEEKWSFVRDGLSRFAGRPLRAGRRDLRVGDGDEPPQPRHRPPPRQLRAAGLRPGRGHGRLHPPMLADGDRDRPRRDGRHRGRRRRQPRHR